MVQYFLLRGRRHLGQILRGSACMTAAAMSGSTLINVHLPACHDRLWPARHLTGFPQLANVLKRFRFNQNRTKLERHVQVLVMAAFHTYMVIPSKGEML